LYKGVMVRLGVTAILPLVFTIALQGCGPIRLDATPKVRGRIVGVDGPRLSIHHKTGRTYDVTLTAETRIVRGEDVVDVDDVCPEQRAIVILSRADRTQASEVRIFGKRCR
jgi:hypothetical protein